MTSREEFLDSHLRNLIRQMWIEAENDPDQASQQLSHFAHDVEECELLEQDGVREKWQAFIAELLTNPELSEAIDAGMEACRVIQEKNKAASALLRKILSTKRLPFLEERKELIP
jgi:hypothetical protein